MSSLYEFKQEDAFRFANSTGIKTKGNNRELQFLECPYCHGGAHKDKYTFSISMDDGRFQCKRASCSVKGNMITLAKDFSFELTTDVSRYHNISNYNNRFRKFKKANIDSDDRAIAYMHSRCISSAVCKKYEVAMVKDSKSQLAFPFKNPAGEITFIKYRNIDYVKGGKGHKEWCEENCMPILFGMYQCNLDNKTLILTEGQLDSLSVAEAGYENAVSVPIGMNGFTWIPHCWDWVHQFEKIIVFGDYEKGRISLLDEVNKRFNLQVLHVREEDYLDCKDANDILRKYGVEQVRKCVDNAVRMPLQHILSLADVKDVNIFEIPKLSTGFRDLDAMLYGGLPFGGLTLVSGKPGEGKSTVASQIIINAINQNHKCFVYSGELPNHTFKAWMNYQVAGPNHIDTYQDSKWHDTRYTLSHTDSQHINSWYADKCFLYDNNMIDGDERESLIKTIESAIQQYGVDVVLIDNLMTALDLEKVDSFDKYDKQSMFVKKLARIALKYNALIMLVAHKRKNNYSTNENDEIAGSSDISNLATMTLVYEKSTNIEPSQRLLKVSKNRMFGKLNLDGWIVNYDEKSKRIYGANDDVNVEYGWTKLQEFVAVDYEDYELPFGDDDNG